MTIQITSLGRSPDHFDGQFEAVEIRHEPVGWDTWPTGPVFPEGHIFQDRDGNAYEIVVPRTVQEPVLGDRLRSRYVHVYTCRPADPGDAV